MQSDAPPDVRQVPLDAFSCQGSNVSLVSQHNKISSGITLAELKGRQLRERMKSPVPYLKEDVFLHPIPVRLKARDKEVCVYAFLDNRSDTTLTKSSTVRLLGLSSDSVPITIKTVNENKLVRSTIRSLEAYSLNGNECMRIEQAVIVDDLLVHRPTISVKDSAKEWSHLMDLFWTELAGEKVIFLSE
ncbi:unnamed protein product [Schistosoma margrebowiei]|uniref:Uncharacterized protein n=1 Tax=Schistosoma margrebowiei TaxID=48269 RepID=A0A183LKM3_9TREM|nr:unnamed protein product [Schistosoma margrebowiei]